MTLQSSAATIALSEKERIARIQSVGDASSRVITSYLRGPQRGVDPVALTTEVISTFARLANPTPEVAAPVAPVPQKRKYKPRAVKPKVNLSEGSVMAATIEDPGAPDDSQAPKDDSFRVYNTNDGSDTGPIAAQPMPEVVSEPNAVPPIMTEAEAKPRVRVRATGSVQEESAPAPSGNDTVAGHWNKLT